jgi:uncharacterized membrane protein (TIGR02234 family)
VSGSQRRREYGVVLLLLAAGALLLLVGFGRTWAVATTAQEGLPRIIVALTGRDLVPVGGSLPLVALAGVAGLVATRGMWRRALGALLVIVGAAGALLAAAAGLTLSDAAGAGATVDRLVGEKTGVVVAGVPAVTSAWWAVAVLGGVLVAIGGLLAVLHGATWPALGRRYELTTRTTDPHQGASAADDSAWDLLDQGIDPTQDRPPGGVDPMLGNAPGS